MINKAKIDIWEHNKLRLEKAKGDNFTLSGIKKKVSWAYIFTI